MFWDLMLALPYWGRVMKQVAAVVCLIWLLGSCGGGGGGDSGGGGIDPRLARLDIYEAQKLRVLGDPGAGVMALPVTDIASVPDSGEFLFLGSATIGIEDPVQPLVLYGDARVALRFDSGEATGTLDNFFGNTGTGNVANYGGFIGLHSGAVGQNIALEYAGVLTAPQDTLIFDGALRGVLLGNPIGALAVADLEADVDNNGVSQDATVIVIAERQNQP